MERAGHTMAPMFETAELGLKVTKADFQRRAPRLRAELLELQQQLRPAPFPVLLVFAGRLLFG